MRIDTGIHTGRMSFEDAVTLFSQVVDFLPGSCQDAAALKSEVKVRKGLTRFLPAVLSGGPESPQVELAEWGGSGGRRSVYQVSGSSYTP